MDTPDDALLCSAAATGGDGAAAAVGIRNTFSSAVATSAVAV